MDEFVRDPVGFAVIQRIEPDRAEPIGIPAGIRQPAAVRGPGSRHEFHTPKIGVEKNFFALPAGDVEEMEASPVIRIADFFSVRRPIESSQPGVDAMSHLRRRLAAVLPLNINLVFTRTIRNIGEAFPGRAPNRTAFIGARCPGQVSRCLPFKFQKEQVAPGGQDHFFAVRRQDRGAADESFCIDRPGRQRFGRPGDRDAQRAQRSAFRIIDPEPAFIFKDDFIAALARVPDSPFPEKGDLTDIFALTIIHPQILFPGFTAIADKKDALADPNGKMVDRAIDDRQLRLARRKIIGPDGRRHSAAISFEEQRIHAGPAKGDLVSRVVVTGRLRLGQFQYGGQPALEPERHEAG